MDGYFSQIYDLCAQYQAPILLHIDPPFGIPIDKLEEALNSHPDTSFIFAHMNAFNTVQNMSLLLEKHHNLYADIFVGFTAYDPGSTESLKDLVPFIKEFPDRVLLSTDSGYGLKGEWRALKAMYQLISPIDDPMIEKKIAHDNYDSILKAEPATKSQIDAIKNLGLDTSGKYDLSGINKLEAGKVLIENGYKMK
jgi:predicted TIM-barrel fold metal-dependent hydrolase